MQEMADRVQRLQQETEEAVQAGNKKYNAMLAERMRVEDELHDEIKVRIPLWCAHVCVWRVGLCACPAR